jgi:hypothetical protein
MEPTGPDNSQSAPAVSPSPSQASQAAADAWMDGAYAHEKLVQWDQDSNGKLYYALWILFMGGFVLSLQFANRPEFYTHAIMRPAMRLFRILALLGSALNFTMQSMAIDSVRSMRDFSYLISRPRDTLRAKSEEEQEKAKSDMFKLADKLTKTDRRLPILELSLRICGALFLLCALFITWNVFPVTTGK